MLMAQLSAPQASADVSGEHPVPFIAVSGIMGQAPSPFDLCLDELHERQS